MAGLPARRDLLRGAAAVGAFLAADAAALLTAINWIGPSRLTPHAFLDAFNNAFGRHPGFRTNHAKGVSVAGWFDSNGNGKELSTAAVFAPGRTSVLGRFSAAGGNPHTADAPATGRGLGLTFGFPGSEQWRTAMLNLPVFPDNSPQSFYDRLVATAVVPATGKPDPAAMTRFYATHPPAARAMTIIKQH
ncbi:MAG: catalase, partial [Mycobacterium sp.]